MATGIAPTFMALDHLPPCLRVCFLSMRRDLLNACRRANGAMTAIMPRPSRTPAVDSSTTTAILPTAIWRKRTRRSIQRQPGTGSHRRHHQKRRTPTRLSRQAAPGPAAGLQDPTDAGPLVRANASPGEPSLSPMSSPTATSGLHRGHCHSPRRLRREQGHRRAHPSLCRLDRWSRWWLAHRHRTRPARRWTPTDSSYPAVDAIAERMTTATGSVRGVVAYATTRFRPLVDTRQPRQMQRRRGGTSRTWLSCSSVPTRRWECFQKA